MLKPRSLLQITTIRSYFVKKRVKAGLDHSMKHLKSSEQITEDAEGFGDMESDFMNVHKSHKQHEKERQEYREQMELWKTKGKYFKVKQPNLLTYAEKEQIKLLNSNDPEEWTPEKLSESFPADPETVANICKAKWIARTEKRIKTHDESVMNNWRLFKSGGFPEMSPKIREHIEKFAERSRRDLKNTISEGVRKPLALPKPVKSEFASIITSCKKYRDEQSKEESSRSEAGVPLLESKNNKQNPFNPKNTPTSGIKPTDDDTFLVSKVIDKRQMRLQDMKLLNNEPKSLPLSEEQLTSMVVDKNPSGTGVVNPFSESFLEKFQSQEIEITKKDQIKYEVSTIKDRIHIPRKFYKKDATYRVEDCYYDSDGEFLYRVPGMTM